MDLDDLFKDISPMNVADVPPKDAAGDTSQKKTTTAVPSTSTAPLNLVTTSTSMGTALNTETSSNATRKLYNIKYII